MSIAIIKKRLQGISITTTTPFEADLEIDELGLAKNLKFLVANNADLIVPCGNTGEFYSLTEQEWNRVVSITKNAVGDSVPIVPGVGNSIRTALCQIEKCRQLDLDGIMVMYPQHVFSSEEGLLQYYQEILEAAGDLAVVLYKKGPLLSDAVLTKLVQYPNLVGVKYAFGRIVDFSRSVQTVGDNIVWSCGTAERFAPFYWLAGARGITSGLSNFAPTISRSMYDALEQSDFDEAMRIQHLISPFEFLREGRGKVNNVPIVKAVMDHIGLVGGACRPPIHPLSDEERDAAIDAISDWGLVPSS